MRHLAVNLDCCSDDATKAMQFSKTGLYSFRAGNGDMSLIVSSKRVILWDGGLASHFERAWSKHLRYLSRSITDIVVTHHDKDHVGGIISLLVHCTDCAACKKRLLSKGTTIWLNSFMDEKTAAKDSQLLRSFNEEHSIMCLAEQLGLRVNTKVRGGDMICSDEDLTIRCISPSGTLLDTELTKLQTQCEAWCKLKQAWDKAKKLPDKQRLRAEVAKISSTTGKPITLANTVAIVCMLEWKHGDVVQSRMLLTADAHAKDILTALGTQDVSKMIYVDTPHHGSQHNFATNFFDHLKPSNVVVSGNHLGHMHPDHNVVKDAIKHSDAVHWTFDLQYAPKYVTNGILNKRDMTSAKFISWSRDKLYHHFPPTLISSSTSTK